MANRSKPNKTKTNNKVKKTKQKNSNKKKFSFLLLSSLLITVIAVFVFFIVKDNFKPKIENYPITHETKFGGVYITIEIDDFNNLGFKYGDSVNVIFSNGYELTDIPYYNGYYVDMGEPLLIAYPGYDYIKVGINYGDDLWATANLNDNDTATVNLNQHEKYLKIQNSRDIHYSDIQGDTPNNVFANFRNVNVGNLKDGILYRSASPVDNSHNRAAVVDRLITPANIQYIVNLSDDSEDLIEHINKDDFNSPYFLSLYNEGKVLPLSLDAQFKGENFKNGLIKALSSMAENEGPYLIHCVEGKDRTGYVLMIIEALLGATYDEIINDYMITYDNYYEITKEKDPERYSTIKEKNIDLMLHYVIGDEEEKQNLSKITDYSTRVKNYLVSIGMDADIIEQLIRNLSK